MVRDSIQSGEFENTSENEVTREEPTKIVINKREIYQNMDSEAAAAPTMMSPQRKQISELMINTNLINTTGFEDVQIDEILECGDDLMDIEQTAFMGSSKVMLQMIDNMLKSID